MPNNSDHDGKEFLNNLVVSLMKAQIDGIRAIKLEDLYGKWGLTYAFQVGPYLSGIPLLITCVLVVVFRRKRLLGVTQKFIMSIMIVDLFYTTISCVRDSLLRIFEMHYGFLEYRVSTELTYSFRIQMICHATSVWLKTLMSLHQVLLIGFPLKVKLYNLKAMFCCFLLFHFVFCIMFQIVLTIPYFEAIPLIQEYKYGYPLKKIMGCRLASSGVFGTQTESPLAFSYSFILLLYSQVIPFVLHFVTITALVILLIRHIQTLSFLIHNASVERIKYLSLLKVNIGLGVSFFLQELPIIFFTLYQIGNITDTDTYDKIYIKYHGLAIAIMCISFSIGKPVDLLIYARLSQSFKDEIKRIFNCFFRSSKKKSTVKSKIIKNKIVVQSRGKEPKSSPYDKTVESTVSK